MSSTKYIKDIILKNSICHSSYLANLPAIQYLMKKKKLSLTREVTFFVGENGTGKSTLLEAIAVAYGFNPEGGTRNFSFATSNTHSELYKNLIITKTDFAKDGFFLRAESFYNVASYIDEVGVTHNYGEKSLHNQSHGESFLSLIQNRFSGDSLYLLDEPEAALSPMRLLTLIAEIDNLVKKNSQFIIATHSPILMSFPNAEILEFSQNGMKSVEYKETEHYKVTKFFLENPDRMLKYLLDDKNSE
ncbi:AAA family ATPase [Anaerotignum sp. MB30-C6]|uniref:AAA family ATPase n=1 Tax=Anaerotignum sp. MB30-C6 TaxID=3070814 RepID=UPI0027DD2006|nr:AAA family ATPase [Anaerotignum sp. MB30-C6]WMI81406.1 AAA family ATPase [Anaerotignum sp. MB30-C6]